MRVRVPIREAKVLGEIVGGKLLIEIVGALMSNGNRVNLML